MLPSRRMRGKPHRERRGRNSTGDRRHIRDMNKNKKMTTPDAAAPMGRWRVLAARCLNPGVTLSSLLRNALFVLFVGGILAYGAGFAWYMLARFDLINLISNTHDDAFYYFQPIPVPNMRHEMRHYVQMTFNP